MQLNNNVTDNFLDDDFQFQEWQYELLEGEGIDENLVFVDPALLDQLPSECNPYSLNPTQYNEQHFYE